MKKRFVRSIAALLSVVLLFGCLAGCGSDTVSELPTDPQTSATAGLASEATDPTVTTEPTAPTTGTEATEPPEPIDISTTGGVVIVGQIGMDDDGWYLIPEQPLDIEFSFFFEPSVFNGTTRLHLFDPQEDGVEKSMYLGQTVTIEGCLSFYRDLFDRVYLFPYRIMRGKTVTQSYAAPELMPPETSGDLYDPSKPLPEQMVPTVRDGHYVYNPYMLSIETLNAMGNDFAFFYVGFVDALLSRQDTYPCPDRNYAEMLSTVIFYECPLYGALAEPFESFWHYDPGSETISIPYRYDEEEHRQVIDRFLLSANEFLATTAPGQTERKLAQNIYHELCTRMTYDDSALVEIQKKDPYYAYLYHTGVCVTFANVYDQLLTQVGIVSTVATCDFSSTMGHAWSLVTIDGKQYHCDPTFELSFKDGTAYCYFGMDHDERTANGLGANGIWGGKYRTYPVSADMISEDPISFS